MQGTTAQCRLLQAILTFMAQLQAVGLRDEDSCECHEQHAASEGRHVQQVVDCDVWGRLAVLPVLHCPCRNDWDFGSRNEYASSSQSRAQLEMGKIPAQGQVAACMHAVQ